jgi:2-haloacid dehalogenase
MIKVFAFELFGTLVDLESISKAFSELNIKIDNLKLFTEIWHSKQLQYAWLLNFINRYESFSELSVCTLKLLQKFLA